MACHGVGQGCTFRGLHLPVSTTESKRSSSPPSSPMNGATRESSPMSFLSCKGKGVRVSHGTVSGCS
jgi:hypothetical protein